MSLKQRVANKLRCNESDLVWSAQCDNPETMYISDIGTNRCKKGYYVKK